MPGLNFNSRTCVTMEVNWKYKKFCPLAGHVYYHRSSQEYIWSLGFMKYMCLAVKLRAESIGGNVLWRNSRVSGCTVSCGVCV